MTTYNLSFIDNATSLLPLSVGVNDAVGTYLFPIILFFFFILFFIVFQKGYEAKSIIMADSFVCCILAGILFGAGLYPASLLSIPIGLLVVSIIVKVWDDL